MAKIPGRNLPLSPYRRLVTDLMYFTRQVPTVCMDRRMSIARVMAARQRCWPRPSWTAIFTKAFGLAAAGIPELRRSFLPYPWPHLYEHPKNIVTLNIERQWGNEDAVFQAQVRSPENRSLEQLDAIIRYLKEEPIEQVKNYRHILRMFKLPWPLRRLAWWVGLNLTGRRRAHNFGTFAISSTGAQGAGIQRMTLLLTSMLHYGMFDEDGNVEMRLSFDHRVLDGGTAARALVEMEKALHQEILEELVGHRPALAA